MSNQMNNVTLEDISTIPIINAMREKNDSSLVLKSILKKLDNVKTYKDLEMFLESEKSNNLAFTTYYLLLQSRLDEVKDKIAKRDEQVPALKKIFLDANDGYPNIPNREIDKYVFGGDLIIYNPLAFSSRISRLKGLSVYELKELLTHCEPNGSNSLEVRVKNFSNHSISKLIGGLKFYNEQIMRLYSEYGSVDNLFFKDKQEKDAIVNDNLFDFISYIVDNSDKSVFGESTESNKETIFRYIVGRPNKFSLSKKKILVDTLSNYLTLGELSNNPVKEKKLERFILK